MVPIVKRHLLILFNSFKQMANLMGIPRSGLAELRIGSIIWLFQWGGGAFWVSGETAVVAFAAAHLERDALHGFEDEG